MMRQSGGGVERSAVTLARTAIAQGLGALAANDMKVALRWLERAHRLVPHDPNATLALATSCLAHDAVRAASLFQAVADKHDVKQAWLGVAAAHLRAGRSEAAEAPLAAALSQHAFSPDMTAVAQAVGLRPPFPGWCALKSDGQLQIQARMAGDVRVLVDGVTPSGTKLPEGWESRRSIDIRLGDVPLLGSPIDIGAIRRVAGCVEASEGGIRGWAWHPADPDTPPTLTIVQRSLRTIIIPADESTAVPDTGPLARPRWFRLARADLLDEPGLVHVLGPDGKDLMGSPLDPFPGEVIDVTGVPASVQPSGADERKHETTVVIPVNEGGEVVLACLASVLGSVPTGTRIVVVDDGSSLSTLVETLDDLARQRKITLVRHQRAMGFPASANSGILAADGDDIVLLNSDTLVPAGWIERLRAAAYASPDIGTVTPLSNDASILSYPASARSNARPDQAATNRLDRLAQRANGSHVVDIPTGVGFCLYIRQDCLRTVGSLRADLFAQGYGEDNDFCLRAHRLGWRSVALTGLFVGHVGGLSFGEAATHLRERNGRIIERHHPGHDALISRFIKADPLADARRRIDRLVWQGRARGWRQAAILITHDEGGGVEQRLLHAVSEQARAGRRPIILRPATTACGEPAIAVRDWLTNDLPNLIYAMPHELRALVALLRGAKPDVIEAHNLVGYPPAVYELVTRLRLPYTVHVHDYAWFCPRVSLLGARDRYCGEPDLLGCETCVTDNGHFLNENISVTALRERSAAFLSAAKCVVVPCNDAAIRMQRHFIGLSTTIVRHQDDDLIVREVAHTGNSPTGRPSVCVAGAIGVHKGFDILLACACDAAKRKLDFDFVVVGHTIDDARLMATSRVFITGPFKPSEAVALIAEQQACLGFIPSICPETWCLTLGEIWRAGLNAVAFDIGAPAERIRQRGRGILLPLGLSASAINNTLVTAIQAIGG